MRWLPFVLLVGCTSATTSSPPSLSVEVVAAPTDERTPEEGATDGAGLSLAQNTSWTIERHRPTTARVVAYGDSIFAGYQRSFTRVARRAAPYVAGEYLAARWNTNVEVVRRTRSGAVAEVIVRTIESEREFMTPATRAVLVEMCGNDYLNARKALARSGGACDYTPLRQAYDDCLANMELALATIDEHAPPSAVKVLANLYYPGFDSDDRLTACRDGLTGQPVNIQNLLLPMMVQSNWQACTIAKRHGFVCVDTFAELMAGDVDTNGDGKVDVEGIRFDPDESMADYVKRVTVTLRATVRDANRKRLGEATVANYMFTDDVHPSFIADTIPSDNGVGRSDPDFVDALVVDGKNPKWNLAGHERFGWAIAHRITP